MMNIRWSRQLQRKVAFFGSIVLCLLIFLLIFILFFNTSANSTAKQTTKITKTQKQKQKQKQKPLKPSTENYSLIIALKTQNKKQSEEINTLTENSKTLQNNLENTKTRLIAYQKDNTLQKIKTLQSSIKKKETLLEDINLSYKILQQELSSVQKELASLQIINQSLTQTKNLDNASIQKKYASLQSLLNETSQEKKHLQDELVILKQIQKQTLEKKEKLILNLEKTLTKEKNSTLHIQKLQEIISQEEYKLQKEKEHSTSLNEQIKTHKTLIKDKTKLIQILGNENKQLQTQLSQLKIVEKQAEQEYDKYKNENLSMYKKNLSLESELSQKNNTIKEKNKTLEKLQNNLNIKEKKLLSQLKTVQQTLFKKEQEISKHKISINSSNSKIQQLQSKYQELSLLSKGQMHTLSLKNKELQNTKSTLTNHKNQLKTITTKLNKYLKEINSLNNEINEKNETYHSLQSEYSNNHTEKEQLKKIIAAIENKEKNTQKKLTNLIEKFRKEGSINKTLLLSFENLEKELQNIENVITEKDEIITKLQQNITTKETNLKKKNTLLSSIKKELETSKIEYEKQLTTSFQKESSKNKTLTNKVENLEQKLQTTLKNKGETITTLQQNITKKNTLLSSIKKELETSKIEYKEQLTTSYKEKEELVQKINLLKSSSITDSQQLQKENALLQNDLQYTRTELNDLKQQLSQYYLVKEENHNLKNEIQKNKSTQEISLLKEKLLEELQGLKKEYKSWKNDSSVNKKELSYTKVNNIEKQAANAPVTRIHLVSENETLENIAVRYYRDLEKWTDIYEANRSVIPNKSHLKKGTVLLIP